MTGMMCWTWSFRSRFIAIRSWASRMKLKPLLMLLKLLVRLRGGLRSSRLS